VNVTFGEYAARLSAIAAQVLGWRPRDFWSATPAELACALGPIDAAATEALDRDELNKLMEQDNG